MRHALECLSSVYVSTLANANETRFVSTSQAVEVYVESMAGAYQTYQASLALADRDTRLTRRISDRFDDCRQLSDRSHFSWHLALDMLRQYDTTVHVHPSRTTRWNPERQLRHAGV